MKIHTNTNTNDNINTNNDNLNMYISIYLYIYILQNIHICMCSRPHTEAHVHPEYGPPISKNQEPQQNCSVYELQSLRGSKSQNIHSMCHNMLKTTTKVFGSYTLEGRVAQNEQKNATNSAGPSNPTGPCSYVVYTWLTFGPMCVLCWYLESLNSRTPRAFWCTELTARSKPPVVLYQAIRAQGLGIL